ncbi:hypothetical protein MRX96_041135 [Rhipicephalus microplus]
MEVGLEVHLVVVWATHISVATVVDMVVVATLTVVILRGMRTHNKAGMLAEVELYTLVDIVQVTAVVIVEDTEETIDKKIMRLSTPVPTMVALFMLRIGDSVVLIMEVFSGLAMLMRVTGLLSRRASPVPIVEVLSGLATVVAILKVFSGQDTVVPIMKVVSEWRTPVSIVEVFSGPATVVPVMKVLSSLDTVISVTEVL